MRIGVRSRGFVLSDSLRDNLTRSLLLALGDDRTRSVSVRLSLVAQSGHRGGFDKRCEIVVHVEPGGAVRVEEQNERLREAIEDAIERAAQRLHRLGRAQSGIGERCPRAPTGRRAFQSKTAL